jgi:hypothetical protein
MKPIQIVGNFITNDYAKACFDYIKLLEWKYCDDKVWKADIDESFISIILGQMKKTFYSGFEVKEAYAVGFSHGMDEKFHNDDLDDNYKTFILSFAENEFVSGDLNGNQMCFDMKSSTCDMITVPLIANTGIMFKSSLPYKILGPGRYTEKTSVHFIFKLYKPEISYNKARYGQLNSDVVCTTSDFMDTICE